MKSISKNTSNEIIIKKSLFVTKLIKISNEEEAKKYISNIKNEYKGANHYCYSYITENTKRFNDDGEPTKTAGMPILNVLENNELFNVLCVVIRYFGGIKLGTGGLVRAYTKSVTECINKCEIVNLLKGKKIELIFTHDKIKSIDLILQEFSIVEKTFDENVKYLFIIDDVSYNNISDKLKINSLDIKEKEQLFLTK